MSQMRPSTHRTEPDLRPGTTTLTRRRGPIVVRIDGVPTYQDEQSGEVMIPGRLAVQLDDAMLAILNVIEQAGEAPIPSRATG